MPLLPRLGRRRTLKLWGPVLAIVIASVIAALIAWKITGGASPHSAHPGYAGGGNAPLAEQREWAKIEKNPEDLEAWVRFIEFHSHVEDSTIDDAAIRTSLIRITNDDAREVATYWYVTRTTDEPSDPAIVIELADRNPPLRLSNFVLARVAMENGDLETAARRYEREGLSFAKGRERNLRRALGMWAHSEAWNELERRARDPRYAKVFDPSLRFDLAMHLRDWAGVARYFFPATYGNISAWPVVLALFAAVLWFIIAARLGRVQDRIDGRALLYFAAFVLGILSVYPTIVTAILEESLLKLEEGHGLAGDAIFFVFGVGLREELWKLLLFLPLLPALKRRAMRIEAMTCGALVGLGFAAEENVSYFMQLNAGAAISRFMTANFLHMALTSLVALSVFDTSRGRATSNDRFDVVFPLVVALHGAYDLFLAGEGMSGMSILSTVILIVLTQRFLRQLLIASSQSETEGLMRLVVWSLALLAGVSYVYATTLVGPVVAVAMIGIGLLGVAILIFMFVRELA